MANIYDKVVNRLDNEDEEARQYRHKEAMRAIAPQDHRKVGLRTGSSSVGVNPKDKIGAAKVDLTLIPPTALAHLAFALMDGATKYGPYNWRVEPVQIRTYIGAAIRHLQDYLDGENCAQDSGAHHLGHTMACCAIILDAVAQQMAVDDRPVQNTTSVSELYDVLNRDIKTTKPEGWGR